MSSVKLPVPNREARPLHPDFGRWRNIAITLIDRRAGVLKCKRLISIVIWLKRVIQPLLEEVESLSEHIREYNERVQQVAQESYPEVARLKQVPTLSERRYFANHAWLGSYTRTQKMQKPGQSRVSNPPKDTK
jgi:hypothetical protein